MSEQRTVRSDARRRFLTIATSALGAVGVAFAAVPFLKSWQPNAKARAAGAPVKVDVQALAPGQMVIVEWRGRPIYIVHRTLEQLATLTALEPKLVDPDSRRPQQPDYVAGAGRALRPEYLVLVGLCTHLGCAPKYRPELSPADLGPAWRGGFFCPCHGSLFDLAGRVYKGTPAAPNNLEVPPHTYDDDGALLIGVDAQAV